MQSRPSWPSGQSIKHLRHRLFDRPSSQNAISTGRYFHRRVSRNSQETEISERVHQKNKQNNYRSSRVDTGSDKYDRELGVLVRSVQNISNINIIGLGWIGDEIVSGVV